MAILITGVSGFIGKYLAKELLKSNYKVYGIYRRNKPYISDKKFILIKADLTKKFLIPNEVHSIFHLAADSPENSSENKLISNNIKSTKNLILSIKNKKIKNFYFFSSIAVYERFKKKNILLKEQLKYLNPNSNYGKSKYISEKLILKMISKKTNILIFRLPAVVAKNSFLSSFYKIKKKIIQNQKITIINPNQKFNGIIHIKDFTKIVFDIFKKKNLIKKYKIINIASKKPEKFKDTIIYMYGLLKKKKNFDIKNYKYINLISIKRLKKIRTKIPTVKQSVYKFVKNR